MDNRIIAIIIAIIVIAVGAFFLLGGGGDEVTIGYLPSDHDAALFVADAQGKYAENGIIFQALLQGLKNKRCQAVAAFAGQHGHGQDVLFGVHSG